MARTSSEDPEPAVTLREVGEEDIAIFFEQQLDREANRMAAFSVEDPSDRQAYKARWNRILADASITTRVVLFEGRVAGHAGRFERHGKPEVSYWIGREFWGRGVATAALGLLLGEAPERPLYARSAQDNAASIRVLEKCGFVIVGMGRGYANARRAEIGEVLLRLE